MVTVTFYNLLRSKYNLQDFEVQAGSINDIISEIITTYPNIDQKDFHSSVVFYYGKPLHFRSFDRKIEDDERIIFTHFVGGG